MSAAWKRCGERELNQRCLGLTYFGALLTRDQQNWTRARWKHLRQERKAPRLCNSDDNCTSESFECNNFVTVGCMQLIRSVTQNAISPIFPNVPGCGFWPFWPAPPAPAILRKNCYPTHPHAGHPRAPAGHWVTRATLVARLPTQPLMLWLAWQIFCFQQHKTTTKG